MLPELGWSYIKRNPTENLDRPKIDKPDIELEKLGITQPRATRGFDDLLAKGFIKIEHHCGCQKDQSIYSLSN
jgi:hypothetical protein